MQVVSTVKEVRDIVAEWRKEGKTVVIPAGTGFMQGIFVEYGITVDDAAEGIRNGGFGSTTKQTTEH